MIYYFPWVAFKSTHLLFYHFFGKEKLHKTRIEYYVFSGAIGNSHKGYTQGLQFQRTRKASSVFSLQTSLTHFLPWPQRAFPPSVTIIGPLSSLGVHVGLAWVVLPAFPECGPCQPRWSIHFRQSSHSSTSFIRVASGNWNESLFTRPYLTSVKCYRLQNPRCSEKGSHNTINSCNLIFTLCESTASGNSRWE